MLSTQNKMPFFSTIFFNPNLIGFNYFNTIINYLENSVTYILIPAIFIIILFSTKIALILLSSEYFTKKPGLTTIAEGITIISGGLAIYDFIERQKSLS